MNDAHAALPDLHGESLARFLQRDVAPDARVEVGLQRVLRTLFPIVTADRSASIEFVDYALEAVIARDDEDASRLNGGTLAAQLKVTVRLIIWEENPDAPDERMIRDVKEQEIYFGSVPLLGRRGAFVVDGNDRAPLLRLSVAPGVRHVTAPDGSPGVAITPRRGAPITLWLDPQGALQGAWGDDATFSGERLCRAFGLEPDTGRGCDHERDAAELARALCDDDLGDDASAVQWFERAFHRGEVFDLSALGRSALNAALGLEVDCEQRALDPRDLKAIVAVLRADKLLEETPSRVYLRAAGDHCEDAAWEGVAATLAKARALVERALARDALDTLMPHDVINARPLMRAWRDLVEKSPFVADRDDTNPLAPVAQSYRVRLDDAARDALTGDPFAAYLSLDPRDATLADLAPDAAVSALGLLDAEIPAGDLHSLAARLAPGSAQAAVLCRARVLASPEALPEPMAIAAEVAERGGALVRAARPGSVLSVSDRRVWIHEDGSAAPACLTLCHQRVPREAGARSLRPRVVAGQRVEAGDVIAEGSAVVAGTLALGRGCRVTRAAELAPGTCRVSQTARAALRSLHVERVEVAARDTRYGVEEIMHAVPGVEAHALRHLDASGVAKLGAAVEAGDVLAGRVTPVGTVAATTYEESLTDASLRATTRATVVAVEALARLGRERSPRHAAIVEAMKGDVADELAELTAAREATGGDDAVDAERARLEELLWCLDRGTDLAPGVVSIVRFELRVERDLAPGDTLASLDGRCWEVSSDDAVRGDVEMPDAIDGETLYLLSLAPAAPAPSKKAARRARKR